MVRVISINPLQGFCLELTFSDGIKKMVDIRPFIPRGLSAALKDENYFRLVTIEAGGGTGWPNGYDFCPNFLHDEVPDIVSVQA